MYSISADEENPMDVLCINAASAALSISDIPWNGPVGAVRVGRVGGEFVVNPTYAQLEESDLDLRIAGTREAILMVECGADEVPEDVMVQALELGHQSIQPLIDVQLRMAEEIGKAKRDDYQRFTLDETLKTAVFSQYADRLNAALDTYNSKVELNDAVSALQAEAVAALASEDETGPLPGDVSEAFDAAYKKAVRSRILQAGIRPDGRGTKDVRPIWCEVDYSPRAHGSGLFTRGETQILTLATLGVRFPVTYRPQSPASV
jgi:polyribonucleotide nucleotidyltransferase